MNRSKFEPRGRRRLGCSLAATALAVTALAVMSSGAAAAAPNVCSGTATAPGVLSGDYTGNVRIDGVCAVNAGPATIHGDLVLSPRSVLGAIFAGHESRLTVLGSVRVKRGATLFLGCTPRSFACLDDPNQEHPSLSSPGSITGQLISTDPLAVIVHNSTIGGSVSERGGGGGVTCEPRGFFTTIGSPVYSDYEDSTVGGSVNIIALHSCWLGVARVHIGGSAHFVRNQLADPDAIEIIDNNIVRNLECVDNSMVWDSADLSPTGALYPRQPEPNTVGGIRSGQCVLASPATDNSPPGPGPF